MQPAHVRDAARIEAAPDSSLGREQTTAEVTFHNGQTLRSRVVHVRGSMARPMSDHELDDKFRAQAGTVLEPARAEQLLRRCRDAASVADLGKQIAAFQPAS